MLALLDVRQVWIADEEMAHAMTACDERRGEIVHPRGESADERVAVRSLERDKDDVPNHHCR